MSSRNNNKMYRLLNPEVYLWITAKARAKKLGKEFNITKYDIKIPAVCPVLGIPLVVDVGKGRRPDSPSLDRKNNELGYTKDNIAVISNRANTLKNNGTLADFEKLVSYLKSS